MSIDSGKIFSVSCSLCVHLLFALVFVCHCQNCKITKVSLNACSAIANEDDAKLSRK